MPNDDLSSSLSALSPQELQQLHTATYAIRTGKVSGNFDMDKVGRLWDALQPVVARGGGPEKPLSQAVAEQPQALGNQSGGVFTPGRAVQRALETGLSRMEGSGVTDPTQYESYLQNPAVPKTQWQAFQAGVSASATELAGGNFGTPGGIAFNLLPFAEIFTAGKGAAALNEARIAATASKAAQSAGDSATAVKSAEAARAALKSADTAAKVLKTTAAVRGATSAGFAGQGAYQAATGKDTAERVAGGVQAIQGAVGLTGDVMGYQGVRPGMMAQAEAAMPGVNARYTPPEAAPTAKQLPGPLAPQGGTPVTEPGMKGYSPGEGTSAVAAAAPRRIVPEAEVQNHTHEIARLQAALPRMSPEEAAVAQNQIQTHEELRAAISKPDTAPQVIGAQKTAADVAGLISPTTRPKSLPTEDLKLIAGLSQKDLASAGLKRDDWLAAKAEMRRRDAPPEGEKVQLSIHELVHQGLTSAVKGGNPENLLDPVKLAATLPHNEIANLADSLDRRSQYAALQVNEINRVLNSKDQAAEITALLRDREVMRTVEAGSVGVDPKTGRTIVAPTEDETGEARVKSGFHYRYEITDPGLRQTFNEILGHQPVGTKWMKDVESGKSIRPPVLDEEQKTFVDAQRKTLDKKIADVRASGLFPSETELRDIQKHVDAIQAVTGKRPVFFKRGVGGAGKAPVILGDDGVVRYAGVGDSQAFWREVMGWPKTSKFSKPSDERIQARIQQLNDEAALSSQVAKTLRGNLSKDHQAVAAPQPKAVAPPAKAAPAHHIGPDIEKALGVSHYGTMDGGKKGPLLNIKDSVTGGSVDTYLSDISNLPEKVANLRSSIKKEELHPVAAAKAERMPQYDPAKGPTKEVLQWRQKQYDELKEMAGGNVFRTGNAPKKFQGELRELVGAGLTAQEIKEGVAAGKTHQQMLDEAVNRGLAPGTKPAITVMPQLPAAKVTEPAIAAQTVKVKKYDSAGNLLGEEARTVAKPAQTAPSKADLQEELRKEQAHLANLSLKQMGNTRTAERVRQSIAVLEKQVGKIQVDKNLATVAASEMIRQAERKEKAKSYTLEPQGDPVDGRADDLVQLLGTTGYEEISREWHAGILKLHDLTIPEDRDYIADAVIRSAGDKGVVEVAKRYGAALQQLQVDLRKKDSASNAMKNALYIAENGKRPVKRNPTEAGFIAPTFLLDIVNELGKYAFNGAVKMGEVAKTMWKWANQGTYANVDTEARNAMYKFRGELHRAEDLGRIAFNDGLEQTRAMSTQAQLAMMDDWVEGRPLASPDLEALRNVAQQLQDKAWVEAHALGLGTNYITDHLRTFWKKPPRHFEELYNRDARGISTANIAGDGGSRRKRIYKHITDGIADGGVPATTNPFEAFLMDYASQMQYIHGKSLLDTFKQRGQLVRGEAAAKAARQAGAIQKLTRVDPKIQSNFFPVQTAQGGTVATPGEPWYMEEGIHKMLKNFLDPDLIRANVVGKTLLDLKNIYTPAELLGPFHFASIVAKSMVVGANQGMNQMLNVGVRQNSVMDAIQGFSRMLTGLATPYTAYKNGRALREAGGQTMVAWQKYNYDKQNFLASDMGKRLQKVIPNIEDTIDGLLEAGARLETNPTYATKWRAAMVKNWRDRNFIASALEVPLATIETVTSPLFQRYIPALKLFASAKEIEVELKRNAPQIQAGETTKEAVSQAAVRRIDNILGELNWENLNASRTMRSTLQFFYRSPGWRMGTLDLVKNAGLGQAKEAYGSAKNRRIPSLDPNLSYVMLSLAYVGAGLAALFMALFAKKAPSSITDLTNPQTGQLDSRGKPIRVDLPLYTSRDIPEILSDPLSYITGGQSGVLSGGIEAVKNRTFEGGMVSERGGFGGLVERGAHAVVPTPFAVTGFRRMRNQGFPARDALLLNSLGLNPSRRDLDMTPAEKVVATAERLHTELKTTDKIAKMHLTQAIQGAMQNNRYDDLKQLEEQALAEDKDGHSIMTFAEVMKAEKAANEPYLKRMLAGGHIRPNDLLKAYAVADREEKDILYPYLFKAAIKDSRVDKKLAELEKR